MKKTIMLLLVGIVAFMLNGCAHGSQKEASECLEDSLLADPPMGYVIELRPLGDFLHFLIAENGYKLSQ